jgi:putative hydrolase of the HAD superfamily
MVIKDLSQSIKFYENCIKKDRKGHRCYLATNNEKHRTEYLIRDRGLGQWFDGVFSSADIGAKKPEGDYFDAILRKIPEHKEDIIFWDDDAKNVEGAERCGLKAETYTDFDSFVQKMKLEIGN